MNIHPRDLSGNFASWEVGGVLPGALDLALVTRNFPVASRRGRKAILRKHLYTGVGRIFVKLERLNSEPLGLPLACKIVCLVNRAF